MATDLESLRVTIKEMEREIRRGGGNRGGKQGMGGSKNRRERKR